jgi:radical SAM superfamily enzyme YgiQ (UPF0313 family)
MMRVLLISSNTESISMVALPLGLGQVAAATRRAGHEVTFLDLLDEDDPAGAVRRVIAATRPEVVGVSVRNIDDQTRSNPRFLLARVRPVVAACRAATAAPVVLGGPGYSIFPAAALAYLGADFGVCGDGEAVFTSLLEHLAGGRDPGCLPGVYVSGRRAAAAPSPPADLDALPLWDESLDALVGSSPEDTWIPIQSRRGCPNECSYCSTAAIQGRRIRLRDARRVAEEVARLARRGAQRFYFVDNSFNLPEVQALAICRWMKELAPGVRWRCILYPHRVGERLVRALAEAGCNEVSLGFESADPEVLRAMNKRFTAQDIRDAAELLAAYGISRMGFLLLGGPGETRGSVEASLAFAESLRLDELRVTVGIRIYPGTPLAERARREGMIAADDDLLLPRFYLAPGLEPWIHERVAPLASPSWSTPPARPS